MNASHIEVFQHWGDSLLRVERYPRWKRLTVGPAGNSDFVASGDRPTVLVDRGEIQSDTGPVAITPETDVLIDVGDQTFRVRAVLPEPIVGGALFAHVDWFFIGVALIAIVTTVLATLVTLLAILFFIVFRYVLALVLALFAMQPPVFLQPPPVIPPPPSIVASANIAPIEKASSPARPFFVRAMPTPIPTITPIPIGDIFSAKLAAKSRSLPKERLLESLELENVAVLSMLTTNENTMSGLYGADSGEISGLIGRGEGVGPGGGGTSVGLGGLGTRGSGGGGTGLGRLGTLGTGVKVTKLEKVEPVDRVDVITSKEEYVEAYEEGGVEGGVVGGVVGGVLGAGPRSGTLSKEEILGTINANIAKIRACYESALLKNPDAAGRVVVSFVVDVDGEVQQAHVLSSSIPVVDACVLSRVREMRFPRPAGGGNAKVTYPFAFQVQ